MQCTYFGTLAAQHETRDLPAQLCGGSDCVEGDRGQLVIVVLSDHQGALEASQQAGLETHKNDSTL